MVAFYVYLIEKGETTMAMVVDKYKAEVYARLIIDGFYTIDDVPAEWVDRVNAKLQELQS